MGDEIMASISEIDAQVNKINRDLEQQKAQVKESIAEIRRKIEREVAQLDGVAKREVERISRELRDDYEKSIADMQKSFDETQNYLEEKLKEAIRKIESVEKDGKKEIGELESKQREIIAEDIKQKSLEKNRSENLLRYMTEELIKLEHETAILLLDSEEIEVLDGYCEKIKDYIGKSMYQVAIALADLSVENIKEITDRMKNKEKDWLSFYQAFGEECEYLFEKWNIIKESMQKIGDYPEFRDIYEKRVGRGTDDWKVSKALYGILQGIRIQCKSEFEDILTVLNDFDALKKWVGTKKTENSIQIGSFYIENKNVEIVKNATSNYVIKLNDVIRLNRFATIILEKMKGVLYGIEKRYEVCDWLIEHLEDEGYCFYKDSRDDANEFSESLLLTKLDFEAQSGEFTLNVMNEKDNEIMVFLSENDQYSYVDEEMENIQKKYKDVTGNRFQYITPDNPEEFLKMYLG